MLPCIPLPDNMLTLTLMKFVECFSTSFFLFVFTFSRLFYVLTGAVSLVSAAILIHFSISYLGFVALSDRTF